jgi:tripartite-type tricarboxylate transporter receptor subunit TctC
MVVPFPAGGAVDAFGRILAERMKASLAQNVVIENVAGASGSLGAKPPAFRMSKVQFLSNFGWRG